MKNLMIDRWGFGNGTRIGVTDKVYSMIVRAGSMISEELIGRFIKLQNDIINHLAKSSGEDLIRRQGLLAGYIIAKIHRNSIDNVVSNNKKKEWCFNHFTKEFTEGIKDGIKDGIGKARG